MPSASTPAMSDSALITTLWPMAATGIWPVCSRVMVKSLHEAGMAIEWTLYCIASLLPMVVLQSVTTAASPAGAVASSGASVMAVSVAALSVMALSVAGVASSAAGVAASVAGAGGGASLPQAASASAQAAAMRVAWSFILAPRTEWGGRPLSRQRRGARMTCLKSADRQGPFHQRRMPREAAEEDPGAVLRQFRHREGHRGRF